MVTKNGERGEDFSIFGIRITNFDMPSAIRHLEQRINNDRTAYSQRIFLVNAHTLNLAYGDKDFASTLKSAQEVFGDGTGVRWAAKLRHIKVRANLVGTDLIPLFFQQTAGRGYRYFLLGADAGTIEKAAAYCREQFSGWEQTGYHHGYITPADVDKVIARINRSRPHLLLVGMGNPIQENWIHQHRHQLQVPLSIGVGGLFDHWGGNLNRAPLWVRTLGFEWLQLLLQQPSKWRRYVIGNPKFLIQVVLKTRSDRTLTDAINGWNQFQY